MSRETQPLDLEDLHGLRVHIGEAHVGLAGSLCSQHSLGELLEEIPPRIDVRAGLGGEVAGVLHAGPSTRKVEVRDRQHAIEGRGTGQQTPRQHLAAQLVAFSAQVRHLERSTEGRRAQPIADIIAKGLELRPLGRCTAGVLVDLAQ